MHSKRAEACYQLPQSSMNYRHQDLLGLLFWLSLLASGRNEVQEMKQLPGASRCNKNLRQTTSLKAQKQLTRHLPRVSASVTQVGHCFGGASGAALQFHHSQQARHCGRGRGGRELTIPHPSWLGAQARRHNYQCPAHSWKAEMAEDQTARYPARSCWQAAPRTHHVPVHHSWGERWRQPPGGQSWCGRGGV